MHSTDLLGVIIDAAVGNARRGLAPGCERAAVREAPDVGETLSERILVEVERLLAHAESQGVTLRLLGSIAIWAHAHDGRPLLERLGRQEYRDIDLIGHSGDQRRITAVFGEMGYTPHASLLASQEYGIARLIFESAPPLPVKVDVFFDTLRFCHQIPMTDRLRLAAPTIPLADLLLSKLQIVRLTENDIKDCTVLVAEHVIGTGGIEEIELARITSLLAGDWGFWHTATTNIGRIRSSIGAAPAITPKVAELVDGRLAGLLGAVERAPKSLRWRARQRVGTRVQWYEEVEDVER